MVQRLPMNPKIYIPRCSLHSKHKGVSYLLQRLAFLTLDCSPDGIGNALNLWSECRSKPLPQV